MKSNSKHRGWVNPSIFVELVCILTLTLKLAYTVLGNNLIRNS